MQKTSKRGEIGYFTFLKKIEIVLITSFTILLMGTSISAQRFSLLAPRKK